MKVRDSSLPIAAILMAGGKSKRMGRDKALLEINGIPLWKHQLETLSELRPQFLGVSSPIKPTWLPGNVEHYPDVIPEIGPLGGLLGILRKTHEVPVLLLAIDMPRMTSLYLQNILSQTTREKGVIPCINGQYEPLCATYPSDIGEVIEKLLLEKELKLQSLCQILLGKDLLTSFPVLQEEAFHFDNWNYPSDIPTTSPQEKASRA